MKPSHEYIDHTADVLFTAKAATLEELFAECGIAVEETQVELGGFSTDKKVTFNLEAKDQESLLFEFLDELLFYKDAEELMFKEFDIKIEEQENTFKLTCTARGEKIDREKHEQKVDVKAITMHLFELKQVDKHWTAQVLIDI